MTSTVSSSALIIIMASMGWAGSLSQGYTGSAPKRRPKRGIFRKDAPSNHDAGLSAHAHRKETMMRFYQQQHRFYCGVDLHARCMYLCILDQAGQTLLHRDFPAEAGVFLDAIAPY